MGNRTMPRRVVNWIVETFFPDVVFYGKKANPFVTFERAAPKANTPIFYAAIFIANYVADRDARSLTVTLGGVEKSGVQRGEWRVTVEQIDDLPPSHPNGEA